MGHKADVSEQASKAGERSRAQQSPDLAVLGHDFEGALRRAAGAAADAGRARPAQILALQRLAGNAAVNRFLAAPGGAVIQAKHIATAYKGKYDANEIRNYLNASEDRNGSTGMPGHVWEHVQDASGTQQYAKTEEKKKTCFVNNAQQDVAVTEALNTTYGQEQLAEFDKDPTKNRVVIKDVAISRVNVWQSVWDAEEGKAGKAKKIHPTKMTVIVDRIAGLTRPELHIQTAYPEEG